MHTSMRIAIGLCVVLAGCTAAPPAKHPAPAEKAAAGAKSDALYRALGGTDGITKVVDATLAEIHGDLRINIFFEKTDMADLRRLVIEQLCAATGGPCEYTGRSMEEAHSGLNLTDADFDAFVEDLVRGMDSQKVPKDLQKQLLDLLGPMRPQVVGQESAVIPAKAGIHFALVRKSKWVPAFAGTTCGAVRHAARDSDRAAAATSRRRSVPA